ncbi:MAG: CocE/NonD family hydrolase [Paenibacillaceae bacterium]|nr:CocE/NonD family hydrolase [Paenibacillaceae bacterium]
MRDGVRLATHVYFPEGVGPWPVLLMRNPYIAPGVDVGEMYRIFTRYGYAVVYQECRGRGSSEGQWLPFANERGDGLDTLGWIVAQPWGDGNIGLMGGSYLSFAQLTMADALPPQVKTMFLMVYGHDQYRLSYMNGMFKHEIFTGWMIGTSDIPPGETPDSLKLRALAHKPHAEADALLFGKEYRWYRDWVSCSAPGDPLWREGLWGQLREVPGRIGVPIHMVGGWHDIALESAFALHAGLREEVRRQSRIVIGPWDHTMAAAASGEREYPGGDVLGAGAFREALAWFDRLLKGAPYGLPVGVIETYTIGAGAWKSHARWQPGEERLRLHLLAGDEAAVYAGVGGKLGERPSSAAGSAAYTYDPADPVPTYGGGALLPAVPATPGKPVPGCVRQPEPGFHPGVLTFLSEPLADDCTIMGEPSVRLVVRSDAADTAFAVKLSEVMADGGTFNIADGITTLAYRNGAEQPLAYEPGAAADIAIGLWPIAWRLARGSRLRLDVSSSNFPAYHIHPNVAGNWAELTETRIARQTVLFGGEFASYVELPIETSGPREPNESNESNESDEPHEPHEPHGPDKSGEGGANA